MTSKLWNRTDLRWATAIFDHQTLSMFAAGHWEKAMRNARRRKVRARLSRTTSVVLYSAPMVDRWSDFRESGSRTFETKHGTLVTLCKDANVCITPLATHPSETAELEQRVYASVHGRTRVSWQWRYPVVIKGLRIVGPDTLVVEQIWHAERAVFVNDCGVPYQLFREHAGVQWVVMPGQVFRVQLRCP